MCARLMLNSPPTSTQIPSHSHRNLVVVVVVVFRIRNQFNLSEPWEFESIKTTTHPPSRMYQYRIEHASKTILPKMMIEYRNTRAHTHNIWIGDHRDKGKCSFPSLQIRRILQTASAKVESGDYRKTCVPTCVVHRKKITHTQTSTTHWLNRRRRRAVQSQHRYELDCPTFQRRHVLTFALY